MVSYANCNKDEYFTIGHNGVCHFCAGEEIEYTKLDRWEQEYKFYLRLIKVRSALSKDIHLSLINSRNLFLSLDQLNVFSKFRTWKAFSVWHVNVRFKRVESAKKTLEDNLFFLNNVNCCPLEPRSPSNGFG